MRSLVRILAGLTLLAGPPALADQLDFSVDVMAVLSKAGCNAGTCHGNQNGKGGFALSLRGQDPEFDFQQLVREYGGRRINLLTPEKSLILSKPSGQLAHQGGIRFRAESIEYQLLLAWIEQGALGPDPNAPRLEQLVVTPTQAVITAPEDSLSLNVIAHFSDGSRRDVTRMAVYEPAQLGVEISPDGVVTRREEGEVTVAVRYLDKQTAVHAAFIGGSKRYRFQGSRPNNYIDEFVYAKLRSLQLHPAAPATDEVFVRRAYLDALGILPTADEARSFVHDPSPQKKEALVELLLGRPEFADHWALKWSDLLRNEEKVLDAKGVDLYHAWIRQAMADGMPLDQFVRTLITSGGSTYKQPAANYYRALRNPTMRAETTARLFLGVRLQCARCHNHPFDHWTQSDYYDWAAVFQGIRYEIVSNERPDKFDKNQFVGEQIVLFGKDEKEPEQPVINVRTAQPAAPRLLGEAVPLEQADADRLAALAAWLTSPENDQFSRTLANRIWFQLMGRGLVEPVDDFRITNPATIPPLLEALAEDLESGGFELRQLVRRIMTSRVYQQSSRPTTQSLAAEGNFAHAVIRRLPAEALLDSQCQVLDVPAGFRGYPTGIRAGQIPGVRRVRRREQPAGDGDRFLMAFGKPERLLSCECERSNETTLNQALMLVSGESLTSRLVSREGRLARLADSSLSESELVDELFWTALARAPSETEMQAGLKILAEAGQIADADSLDENKRRFEALQDLAWALMNAKEFLYQH